ncbi:MAG: hypothetical protein ACO1SV_20570 [Fimbriimonas sp.]
MEDDLEDLEWPDFPAELLSADEVRVSWVTILGDHWGRGVLEGNPDYLDRNEREDAAEWARSADPFGPPRIVRVPAEGRLPRVRWIATLQSWDKLTDEEDASWLELRWYAPDAQNDLQALLAEVLKTIDWRLTAHGFSID